MSLVIDGLDAGFTMTLAPGSVLRVGSMPGAARILAVLAGFQPPATGRVLLGGEPLRPGLIGRAVGYLPQGAPVVGTLTAVENVALVLIAQGVPAADAWAAAEQHLGDLGLPAALQHNLAEQLSGGQRQRVAFARATIGRPALLVADDPASELDPQTAERVVTVIQELLAGGSIAVLTTTSPVVAQAFESSPRLALD